MDSIDTMILREILWNPVDPHHAARGPRRPWDIARALGMHGTTVKRRIQDMREAGFLKGVPLQPAPPLVGRRSSNHFLTYADAAAKRRALDLLKDDPAIWEVYGFVGRDALVHLSTPAGADFHAAARRLAEETGAVATRFHHVVEWPVPTERVSALDLRILAAFAEDALRPISEAAGEVGVAPKTVTTRMRTLARHRAYIVHPIMDHTRMEGGMAAYLDLAFDLGHSEPAHAEIPNRFPLALCRSARGAENGHVVIAVAGATELDEALARAESIPGVQSVEARIMHETFAEPARWKDALLARAEALARAKGVWVPSWRAKPQEIPAPSA